MRPLATGRILSLPLLAAALLVGLPPAARGSDLVEDLEVRRARLAEALGPGNRTRQAVIFVRRADARREHRTGHDADRRNRDDDRHTS
jgi:hypothetical protein